MIDEKNIKIAVIGLGYVGLPLAVEFGKYFPTVGFDVNQSRIAQLKNGEDLTLEVESEQLKNSNKLDYSSDNKDVSACNIFIITVPTPLNELNQPDLNPLISATKNVGKFLKQDDIVIYESTVFPGATEEVCVPILEKISGLKYNENFFCGYSPERINPGDKFHRLASIVKVTSGSTPEIAQYVDRIYQKIITAGTFQAESIKVAEAAKVIENTQRDVNIALINELAQLFDILDIDSESVLKAAATKWNFLNFAPGLVGGHCIGVDPYYLTYRAIQSGYKPEMILAGREINNGMAQFVVMQIIKLMKKKSISLDNANILIMGLTFKENCPDIRNTGVAKMVSEFNENQFNVDVYDPWVNQSDAYNEYSINIIDEPYRDKYDAIVIAVAHDVFKKFSKEELSSFGKNKYIIYDLKYLLAKDEVDGRL